MTNDDNNNNIKNNKKNRDNKLNYPQDINRTIKCNVHDLKVRGNYNCLDAFNVYAKQLLTTISFDNIDNRFPHIGKFHLFFDFEQQHYTTIIKSKANMKSVPFKVKEKLNKYLNNNSIFM